MTHVKRLVVQGFKSFPKKTEILFDKGMNVILGPNGSGKSSSYDTLVTLSSGEEIELGKLVDEQISQAKKSEIGKLDEGLYVNGTGSIKIISLNKESMISEERAVSKFIRRDGDVLYRIKTRTGKELKATGCHPVMTFVDGGVNSVLISDLKGGSLIATPRYIEVDGKEMDNDYARLLGYIIGDGYIAKDRIEFVNNDKEIIADYINLTKNKLKLDIRERNEKNITRIYTRDKKFVKEVRDLFFLGYKETITSEVKQIPQEYMKADDLAVANLLAGLYDTDGSVRKDIAVIEYCTKNPKLARQIQGLLLRFGITSKVKKRICNAVMKEKKVPGEYHYIYVYGRYNFERFLRSVPLRARHKVANIKSYLERNTTPNSNIDLLPREINGYVKETAVLLGIKPKPLRKQYPAFMAYVEDRCLPSRGGINRIIPLFENKFRILREQFKTISLNQINLVHFMDEMNLSSHQVSQQIGMYPTIIRNIWATNKFNAKPENLQKFYNVLKEKYSQRVERIHFLINLLRNIANSDIYWDEIVSIEKLDTPKYVYDLTIEENHNFIANNIFVHNSNISDALCFVLGRLSIKSMRAAKSSNLIFMGSKYVKPAKEASVEIVFDNSNKDFNINSPEVQIKRMVRANGQSVYKINHETKTRTEIIEALAQAGIDPHGFNIILQGQISAIAKMHSEDRRKIIEEVAGISVYEVRKEKSLHELEKTDERLKEISTVLRERTSFLKNLEKERAQAQRYKDIELLVKRCKATILQKRVSEKEKELAIILKEINSKLENKAKARESAEKVQRHVESLNNRINEINKSIQEATGLEQEQLHNEISNLKAELEGLRVRKESYEHRKAETERRIEEVSSGIPDLERELDEMKKESPEMGKKADSLRQKKQELGEIEKERKNLLTLRTELSSLKDRIKDKEQQLHKARAESETLLKQIEESSEKLAHKNEKACEGALENSRKLLEEKGESLETLTKSIVELGKILVLAESEIKRLERVKADVDKVDICPLCQSKITKNHKEHVEKEANQEIDKHTKEIDDSRLKLREEERGRDKLKNEMKNLSSKISSEETELVNHKRILEKNLSLKRVVADEKELKEEITRLELRRRELELKVSDLGSIEIKYDSKISELEEVSSRTEEDLDTAVLYKSRELENMRKIIQTSKEGLEELEESISEFEENIETKSSDLENMEEQETELNERFKKLFAERDKLQLEIQEGNLEISEINNRIQNTDNQTNELKIRRAKIDAEKEALSMELKEFPGIELLQGKMEVIDERLKKNQEILQSIGSINLRALEVYDEIKKEYDAVYVKVEILEKEKIEILKIIEEIDKKKKKEFMKTFKAINDLFSKNFSKLYNKGVAYLEIENKEDIFAEGISIVVKLAKGKYFDVASLSGGEQTLIALALLFAIQEHRPYHFYIFDEIDAALDKRNSERLAGLFNQYMKSGQYIVITHNDAIIMNSDTLYGVSMQDGVSKVLSLKVD